MHHRSLLFVAALAVVSCSAPAAQPIAYSCPTCPPCVASAPPAPVIAATSIPKVEPSVAKAPSDPMADKLQMLARTESRAFEWVRSLVDEAGPRLAGSPGDKAAVAW